MVSGVYSRIYREIIHFLKRLQIFSFLRTIFDKCMIERLLVDWKFLKLFF